MTQQENGCIYILTNPSFPQYVKIGYADDVNKRLEQLNRSECIPFAFRLYAYYRVNARLTDIKLHSLIDRLNPNLRTIEDFNGKKRVREFYAMEAHDAYRILETIAEINNLKENLVLVEPTEDELESEDNACEIRTKRKVTQLPRIDWMMEQGLLQKGDQVYVINHPDQIATIVDATHVVFRGATMTLNRFGCEVTGWKAIQAYAVMKVVGREETLATLREKRMKELGMTV